MKLFPVWLGAFFLAACAALPTAQKPAAAPAFDLAGYLEAHPAPRAFELLGRVVLASPQARFLGKISWRHRPEEDILVITDDWGMTVAQLQRLGDDAVLVTKDGRWRGMDVYELLGEVTDMDIPPGILFWISGRPKGMGAQELIIGQDGTLSGFVEDGWKVSLGGHTREDGLLLPRRISVRGEKSRIALSISQWKLDSDNPSLPPRS